MTDKLSKCCEAEVWKHPNPNDPIHYYICSKCGKPCEVVEKQYIFDATKSADGYSNEPIEIQITPTVPALQDRLLTPGEIKAIAKKIDVSKFNVVVEALAARENALLQAQDIKTSALVRAECQEENIKLVNEVVGLVTELRDTKATHKKELERINKAIKEFEQSFWGYIQSRRPPVDEPDTMSIKVTSTFINKRMQALKASVLEGK